MEADALWRSLVQIVRGLTDREAGPPIRGQLRIDSNGDLEALRVCMEAERDTHLAVDGHDSPATLAVGQTVTVSLAPRFGFGLLVDDLAALLKAQGSRVSEPKRFLLLDGLVSSDDASPEDGPVARYRLVLRLVKSLRRSAAFLDPDEQALIFISDGRFDVPVYYTADDVAALNAEDIQALTTLIPADTHEKQCAAILASAVVEQTRSLPSDDRFKHLLNHAGDLRKRYDEGYKLFASGFSYDKVRDEVEAARVEYAGKVHKVFSDIQNQLLGIPVATIVVATQMKDAKVVGYEFWVNTAVLVGCWVFAILMVLLLRNQGHTLDVLNDEIQRQKRQLEKDYAAVAGSFAATFIYLTKRAKTQRWVLRLIDGIVLIGLLLSHVVYFKLTPPAWAWVAARLPI